MVVVVVVVVQDPEEVVGLGVKSPGHGDMEIY
jgi:hypothetical protein